MSRRDFLKLAAAGAAGAVIAVASHEGANQDSGGTERVYRSGETIDSFGVPVTVNGWCLSVPVEALRSYDVSHPQTEVVVQVMGAWPYVQRFETSGQGSDVNKTDESGNVGSGGEPTHQILYLDYTSRGGYILKSSEKRRGDGGELLLERVCAVELGGFPCGGEGSPASHIVLEFPLPDDKVNALVARYEMLVGVFQLRPDVGICRDRMVGSDKKRTAFYHSFNRSITITEGYFKIDEVPIEGERALVHEYCHSMFDSIWDGPEGYDVTTVEAVLELVKVEKEFHDYLGESLTKESAEEDSLFNIFDESHYTGLEVGGHPYDSYQELFASVATTLHFYPEVFIDKYKVLSEADKEMVKKTMLIVKQLLEKSVVGKEGVLSSFIDFENLSVMMDG